MTETVVKEAVFATERMQVFHQCIMPRSPRDIAPREFYSAWRFDIEWPMAIAWATVSAKKCCCRDFDRPSLESIDVADSERRQGLGRELLIGLQEYYLWKLVLPRSANVLTAWDRLNGSVERYKRTRDGTQETEAAEQCSC